MATTTRQTSLLVSQDWTKLYQAFRNADFQSYDFETLRASMVSYLQLYYPEDFNDFIESSEFIALIDMIAFLGQSLAFRADLNARENFIDTAQRRDSILKLARLVSYNPKRNIPAFGLLKFKSVSTTENVYDSNGLNLSGLVINWADAGNSNWLEQMTLILNAALVNNQAIGKPAYKQIINGITNEEYQINLVPNILSTYSFKSTVAGSQMPFEMVSPTSSNKTYIYEADPKLNAPFNFLYRNDNLGNGSNNTGYFLYFKQGELKSLDFNLAESIPNRVYSINTNNINNTDIWLYSLDSNGNLDVLWEKVPAVANTNVIYNATSNKNIYQINSRAGDQIDLIFGDGSFANIPQGNFRIYYRVSNGLQYKITPDEMQGVVIPINYVSAAGRVETITITVNLQYTVANASTRESLDSVKQKAPQQFYTQNRMITGEDYNILPYTLFNNILKIKAVNRTSSGISRYLDVIDVTGKYSSTNIFAQDGMLYRDNTVNTFSFDYNTTNDIYKIIYDRIAPIAQAPETLQFFYAHYPLLDLADIYWHTSTVIANGCTGYFVDSTGKILQIGAAVTSTNKYIVQSSIVKMSAGPGNYFDAQNRIQTGKPRNPGDKYYVYAAIELVVGDGTNGGQGNLTNGVGPVTINQIIPVGETPLADRVFAVFNVAFSNALVSTMVGYIQAFANFGLRYDIVSASWKIITPQDLNTVDKFTLTNAGDTSGHALDSSWLIAFQTVGKTYTVSYRGLNYVFESVKETNFYYDGTTKIFDATTGLTVKDQIKVLKVNTQPDNSDALALDYIWNIYKSITEVDGFTDINRIYVTFSDINNDGIPDNPELFELLVNPNVDVTNKYVYFKSTTGYDNFVTQVPVDNNTVVSQYATLREIQVSATLYQNGQLFYVAPSNTFYQLSIAGAVYTPNLVTGYSAKLGRQDLYFQYRHNSPNNRRIDPSPNNIIDLYILAQQYSIDYQAWAQDITGTITEPSLPTSEQLELSYSSLDNYKAVSDTIIYNPAQFKPLFGAKADPKLQAKFKVVKNSNIVISDNEIQTLVIAAINGYFNVANWDFGEKFYFSELAAYLHMQLVPKISSIVIVPANEASVFGSLMQVNANINEIITSCATVNDVKIISAITAAQLNQTGALITA
jgi:hypothetical protein